MLPPPRSSSRIPLLPVPTPKAPGEGRAPAGRVGGRPPRREPRSAAPPLPFPRGLLVGGWGAPPGARVPQLSPLIRRHRSTGRGVRGFCISRLQHRTLLRGLVENAQRSVERFVGGGRQVGARHTAGKASLTPPLSPPPRPRQTSPQVALVRGAAARTEPARV